MASSDRMAWFALISIPASLIVCYPLATIFHEANQVKFSVKAEHPQALSLKENLTQIFRHVSSSFGSASPAQFISESPLWNDTGCPSRHSTNSSIAHICSSK